MVIRSPLFSPSSSRVGADTSASRHHAVQRLNALTGKSGYYFQAYTTPSGDLPQFQALGAPGLTFGRQTASPVTASAVRATHPEAALHPQGFFSTIAQETQKNALALSVGVVGALVAIAHGIQPVFAALGAGTVAFAANTLSKWATLPAAQLVSTRQTIRERFGDGLTKARQTLNQTLKNIPAAWTSAAPALQFGAKAAARHHGTPVSSVDSAAMIASQRLSRLSSQERGNPFAGYHAVVRFSGVSAPNAASGATPAAIGFQAQSARLASTSDETAVRSHALSAARRPLTFSGMHNLSSPVGMLVLSANAAGVPQASMLTARRNGAVAQTSITINL